MTYAHVDLMAKTPSRSSVDGINARIRKSNLQDFLLLAESNKRCKEEGNLNDLRILNFLDISLDGAVVRAPVTVA